MLMAIKLGNGLPSTVLHTTCTTGTLITHNINATWWLKSRRTDVRTHITACCTDQSECPCWPLSTAEVKPPGTIKVVAGRCKSMLIIFSFKQLPLIMVVFNVWESSSLDIILFTFPRGVGWGHGMVGEGRMAIPCSHAPPRLDHQKLQTEIPLLCARNPSSTFSDLGSFVW